MIGNVWFDREDRELAYNIEDPAAPLLPSRDEETEGVQVDPAQKRARSDGRSPRALLVPTLADTLMAYTAGKAKVFGVSGKDRSAVAMAGKVGKAFWFSTDTGDFITSAYYYDQYPDWNAERKAESYAGTDWELAFDPSTYRLIKQDDRSYEIDLRGFGRTFPHRWGSVESGLLFTQLLTSPAGDDLMLDFSKELIRSEDIGQDAVPDYLSLSFSGVDAVNHFFGPSSLENEEVVRRLDRMLAELFEFVDDIVGLEHTLIVLSADHGMPEMAEYMTELGYDAERMETETIVDAANRVGDELGIDEVVRFFFRPYLYLREGAIEAAGLSVQAVERAVADALTDMRGITLAMPATGTAVEGDDALVSRIDANRHTTRSGNIYIAQDPYWFVLESGPIAVMHGSPWRYDTYVPIIFAGMGIDAQRVDRLVHPADVAPTIAAILGISPPAGSSGTVLVEAAGR
jgi:predicted AlkP superfamily pyrophosphatase or phosphodiesterase